MITKSATASSKDGVVGAAASLKLHKDRILSICLAVGPNPLKPIPRLVTVSACNRIGVWDITGGKAWGQAALVSKLRLRDITLTGACALTTGIYQSNSTAVLLATNGPQVRHLKHLMALSCYTMAALRDKQAAGALRGPAAAAGAVLTNTSQVACLPDSAMLERLLRIAASVARCMQRSTTTGAQLRAQPTLL
jgi:hypothetical protein